MKTRLEKLKLMVKSQSNFGRDMVVAEVEKIADEIEADVDNLKRTETYLRAANAEISRLRRKHEGDNRTTVHHIDDGLVEKRDLLGARLEEVKTERDEALDTLKTVDELDAERAKLHGESLSRMRQETDDLRIRLRDEERFSSNRGDKIRELEAQLKTKRVEFENDARLRKRLRTDVAELETQVEVLKGATKPRHELRDALIKIADLEAARDGARAAHDELNKRTNRLWAELHSTRSARDSALERLEDVRGNFKILAADVEERDDTIAALERKILKLEDEIARLELVNRRLGKATEQANSDRNVAETTLEEAERGFGVMQANYTYANKGRAKLRDSLHELEKNFNDLSAEYKKLEKQNDRRGLALDGLSDSVEQIERLELEVEELEVERDENIGTIQDYVTESNENRQYIENLKADLATAEEQIQIYTDAEARLKNKLNAIEDADVDDYIAKLKEREERIDELETKLKDTRMLRNFLESYADANYKRFTDEQLRADLTEIERDELRLELAHERHNNV